MAPPRSFRSPLATLAAVLAAVLLVACAPAAVPAPSEARTATRTDTRTAPEARPDPEALPPVLVGAEPFTLTDPDTGWTTYGERLGAGPQVLLVHGIGGGSSVFQYRRIAPALAAAGYEAVAIDLYGFGRSTRPVGALTGDELVAQIGAVLDALDAPRVHLVANGLAGAYAVRLAVERPARVGSLSLIAPTGLGRLDRSRAEAEDAFGFFGGPLGAVLYGALLAPEVQLRFLLDAYAERENVTPEVRRVYSDYLSVPNARWAVLSFVSGLLDQDLDELWPQVAVPTWIAWGAEAETTPPEDAERFTELRPGTRVEFYEDAKLLPNVERADAYLADLLPFLARTLPWGEGPPPTGSAR